MPAIEPELQALKDNVLDMLSLVRSQMIKCKDAIHKNDIGLAEDVIREEKKFINFKFAFKKNDMGVALFFIVYYNILNTM
jgi:phosphate transport system protein